ncbi:hypothetical protein [Streptomyces sp. NPDC056524]|uniref:hypothetical protein n=1 Tax=Streptomyces sp. NPDC056524 TaxID=3345851 RepID=UPI0036AF2F47
MPIGPQPFNSPAARSPMKFKLALPGRQNTATPTTPVQTLDHTDDTLRAYAAAGWEVVEPASGRTMAGPAVTSATPTVASRPNARGASR